MYELSRVRLHTVGPKGARYQDITIDLREVGAPVAAPIADRLPGMSTEVGDVSRRPSPATVLFLENGGGKTVLIKLIFSVMLPGRRQVVGTSNTRVLEKFVLAGDVAHVALEWQDAKNGQRVVTGKVSEWRGHVISADATRLTERWYSFRPTLAFTLDTLPFTEKGRLVSLTGFHDRIGEAQREEPQLQATWERNHRDWTEHLQNLRLDPALFTYQRRMNAGEGEAADAFTFKTDEAFIDWLLTAITPDEEPQTLGDVVNGYADKLAARADLVAERDFVSGALDRLGPLAHAAREKQAAEDIHADAQRDAARLAAALAARRALEQRRFNLLKGNLEEVVRAERGADQEARRLNAIVLELSREVARMRWEEAERRLGALKTELEGALRLGDAWRATDALLRYKKAHEEAEQFRKIVRQKEIRAEPVVRARQTAALRFARGLLGIAGEADERATALEEEADALDEHIEQSENDERGAIRAAEAARGRAGAAQKTIDSAVAAVQAAVAEGLMTAGADVTAAANDARQAATEAEKAVDLTLTRMDEIAAQRQEAAAALDELNADRQAKTHAAETLGERLASAHRVAGELAGVERLAELLGSDAVQLDPDTPILFVRLSEAIKAVEEKQIALRIAASADRRALEALGNGGLLPPAEDVSAARQLLEGEGITGWSGWQYLAQFPAEERDQVLSLYPHLVDGIVLNSADDLEDAERLLTEARLLPRSVIAVGATASLASLDAHSPAGLAFIVPPNPAMYDEVRAEQERQKIQRRLDERQNRLGALQRSLDTDRSLVTRLESWQTEYPPGTLDRLAREHNAADEAARLATTQARDQRDAVKALVKDEKDLKDRLPRLRREAKQADVRATRLASVAARHAEIPSLQDAAKAAESEIRRARNDADAAREAARGHRNRQNEARRAADGHRRVAETCRAELREIHGGGAADEAIPVPGEPLEVLRTAYRTAAAAYERAQVNPDLRAELAAAENAEAEARAAVAGLADEVRTSAEELLIGPDGADEGSRAAASARIARLRDDLQEQVAGAERFAGKLQSEYERHQPQDRSLEPYGRPHDIAHGEELIARATVDWHRARDSLEDIQRHKDDLAERVVENERTQAAFGTISESLETIVIGDLDPAAESFPGTTDDARERRDAVRETCGQAVRLLEEAAREVRRAADSLAQYSTSERFTSVATPIRRQLIATERERLPDFAADWEAALRPRLRVLTDELEQIERHRAAIVARLHGMVDQALGKLRSAQRTSKLPDGLDDWSQQEFLRISFAVPEQAVLAERLGEVLDEVASAKHIGDRAPVKRDGLSLLLRGVRAATQPKGVKVEMLKPDAVLRTERVRVSEISDVFSGGQLLTAAIILYCTMAWLRANERGHVRRPHAGVLFLDNPIGRASAGYLLELQLAVADKLGVQLIYTTGLFDTNALSVFPLIIRMRNDADLRAGMKYLTVDEEIRQRLPAESPDGTGALSASRLFVHPRSKLS